MASKEFINFFEKSGEYIQFKVLYGQSIFGSPIKQKLNVDSVKLYDDLKDRIIINLNLNSTVKEIIFTKEDIAPIYKLFVEKEINESFKAQLIFLLHASKMDINSETLRLFLINANTIKIINENELLLSQYAFFPGINEFIKTLLTNQSIKNVVSQVIYDLTKKEAMFPEAIKVSYFKINISGLYGFSGIDEVYINLNEFNYLFDIVNYNFEMKISLLKLRAICLVAHELTHSILSRVLKDFNMSSPTLITQKSSKVIEAGVLAEKLIFKCKTDWQRSLAQKFDIEYCFNYMNQFLDGTFKVSNFDLITSKLVETENVTAMAFSYEKHEIDII